MQPQLRTRFILFVFLIVGEVEDKNEKGKIIEKVLATACPYDMVENYKKIICYFIHFSEICNNWM